VSGTTGTTGTTGATGATGSAPTAIQATYEGSFTAGGSTFTISGSSCDVAAGSWTGTVVASGAATGQGTFTFSMEPGKNSAKVVWSFDGTFDGADSTFEQEGAVSKGGPADRPTLQFFGELVVTTGKDEARGPANTTADVTLGPAADC
jgi:hypothetical protein